jgi:hypothetical protein
MPPSTFASAAAGNNSSQNVTRDAASEWYVLPILLVPVLAVDLPRIDRPARRYDHTFASDIGKRRKKTRIWVLMLSSL